MDHSNLRQRITGSARGLACSTISGVVGIEADLRDSRTFGKQRILRSSRNQEATSIGGDRKRRRALHRIDAASSIRAASSSTKRDQIQREFNTFCDDKPTMSELPIEAQRLDSEISADKYDRPATWHLANDEDDIMIDIAPQYKPPAQASESRQELRSTAAKRLDQVQQHISTTRTIPAQQHAARHAYLHPASEVEDTRMSTRNVLSPVPLNRPLSDEQRRPDVDESMDKDDDKLQGFHCPYMDCHNNLSPPRLGYLMSTYGRICVHVNCDCVFENKKDWLTHIVMSHHDIQTSMLRVESEPEASNHADRSSYVCDAEQSARIRSKFSANCSPVDPDLYQRYSELKI